MASVKKAMVLFLIFAAVKISEGEVHKVGDSDGWTVGNVSYTAWASSKTFRLGDTVIFEYNKNFHNVLRVNRASYRACNATAPLATYTTGNDSITINSKGHHLFICGFPGHCSLGQKVDIRIASPSAAPVSSPSISPTSPPSAVISPPTPTATLNSSHATPSFGLSFVLLAIGALSIASVF